MPLISSGKTIVSSEQINPGVIKNSDIEAAAGIEGSKVQELDLGTNAGVLPTTGLVNAHVAAAAAIALSKLASGTEGNILYYNSSGVLVPLAVGTSGQVLESQGAAAAPQWADAGGFVDVAASDNLKLSANTERTQVSVGSYAKHKEILISHSGTIKVTYDLNHSLGGGTYYTKGRVYINGSAVGTENNHQTTSYATYTDASISVVAGDLVQLYMNDNNAGGHTAYCRNFRLSYDAATGSGGAVVTD